MNRNFNEIYENIHSNGIEEINLYKKKRNRSLILFIIVTILAIASFKKLFLLNEIIMIIGVALVLVTFINYMITDSNYKKMFKSSIMRELVYSYNPNFRFTPDNGVTRREFVKSGFQNHFDEFYSEDLIEGAIDEETHLKMSQIKLIREEYETDSNGNTRKRRVTIFEGLFGIVDIPSKLLAPIELSPNNFLNRYNKNRIEMDSQEFEKQYDMFASDKVRAMEIFTADLIDEINKLREDTGYTIQLKVIHNQVFFRIHCGEAFEAPLLKNATDYSVLYKYFKMIDSPISIITKLIENANETEM